MAIKYTYRDSHKKLLPRTVEALLIGWVRRLGGIALLAFSAAVWLSLLTWSAKDPSLSVDSRQLPSNALGAPGAAVADLLLHTIGVSSVVLMVCCLVWGLQLLLSDRVEAFQIRAFFAAVAVLAIAGGSSALPTVEGWMFHHGYGGILGDVSLNLVVGLLARFQMSFTDTLAGLSLFSFGAWTFSRAIGLDRKHIFLILKRRKSSSKGRKRDTPKTEASTWVSGALGGVASVVKHTMHSAPASSEASASTGWSEPELPSLSPIGDRRADRKPVLEQPKSNSEPDVEHRDDSIMGLQNRLEASVERDAKRIAKIFAPEGGEASPTEDQPELPLAHAPQALPMPQRDLPRILRGAEASTPEPESKEVPAYEPALELEVEAEIDEYSQPSLEQLSEPEAPTNDAHNEALEHRATAAKLKRVLADFRVTGDITSVRKGPVITVFEFVPSAGIKASRIIALADDIARSMSASSARIAAMPGRNGLAIELPNESRETVALKTLFNGEAFQTTDARLPLMLGVDIVGNPIITDLSRMPHLLVAGTTGSGKSVGINAMILSLLYRKSPQECRFLMIDPKMLELSAYNGIPHMLAPVVTDPAEAVEALRWAVGEMEERYKRMADLGVRNIESYNKRVAEAQQGESFQVQTGFDPVSKAATFETRFVNLEPMPNIVIVVDEFADLMSVAGKEVEAALQRLAQMARAAGMHLIMATQRPSVDVITGTLKANLPARLAYRVASKIDSRTILQDHGAEQLLGHGDMLLALAGDPLLRIHGPMVTEDEVKAVTRSLRKSSRKASEFVARAA